MQSGETLFGINRWRHLIVPDLHKASLLSYWLFRVSKGEGVDLRLLFKVHNLLFLKHVKQTDRCETVVSTGVTLLLFTTISECFTQQKKERGSLTLVFSSVMKTSKKKLNSEWSPAWKHDCEVCEVWIFLFVCLWWRHNCEIQQFLWSCAADHCQKLLNYQKRGGSNSQEFGALQVILHAGAHCLCAWGSRCGGRTVKASPASPALLPTC